MQTKLYTRYEHFRQDDLFPAVRDFQDRHPWGSFFQSAGFYQLIEGVNGYRPVLLVAHGDSGEVGGALLGVFQRNGGGLRSWMSRRLIVWGGPLLAELPGASPAESARRLLTGLTAYADGRAIFAEFRNMFDTTGLADVFQASGFTYRPHVNYLVETDDAAAVLRRMSGSRARQIRSSLKAGATIGEPETEADVWAFYHLLDKLYREKVKKPLPGPDLFLALWRSPLARIFLVRYEGRVVGGIACPLFRDRVIYEWYVCGEDGRVKGVHPSVLATWAPIEYGLNNGFGHFDFMGAGRPGDDYGVRTFKARFGGREVCHGRYELILNKPLYRVGKWGLKVYQKLS